MKNKPKPPGYWTKETVKDAIKDFKSFKEWINKDKKSYSAAAKLKLLNDKNITGHLKREIAPPGCYWTKETVKDAIKDFKSFKEWYEKDGKSYAAAQRLKLLDDKNITGHLIKVEGKPIVKWHKKNVLEDALLYDSKSSWKSNSAAAYRAAKERGYFDEAIKHMTLLGSKYKRCLYSYEIKNEKIIYIGLTYDFKQRINTHKKTKRFKKLIKKYGKEKIVIKKLTDYIDREEAATLEIKLIQQKKDEGFALLNVHPGGGLGGDTLEWTKEKTLKSAKKFQHKVRWKEKEAGAYAAAQRGGYLEEATAHMEKLNRKGKWSKKEDVLENAQKYNSRSAWQDASVGAYEAAKNNGWFEEAVAHMTKPDMTQKWFKETVLADAKNYKYRTDWNNASVGAYEAAKNNGWFEEAVAHMGNKHTIPLKWNKKATLADAKNYKYRSDWKKNSIGAYNAARRDGYFKKAVAHMTKKK